MVQNVFVWRTLTEHNLNIDKGVFHVIMHEKKGSYFNQIIREVALTRLFPVFALFMQLKLKCCNIYEQMFTSYAAFN